MDLFIRMLLDYKNLPFPQCLTLGILICLLLYIHFSMFNIRNTLPQTHGMIYFKNKNSPINQMNILSANLTV